MKLRYIFGPILSRRLGVSLGIDLIPYKTCSLDCVYCECGKTTQLINKREEFIASEEVINELNGYLKANPKLDYITFAGSGEPTLYKDIGKIIRFIKNKYPQYKIALITNSTLLKQEDLLNDIKEIDLLIPSLDAVSEIAFKKINRPSINISVDDILEGIMNLRKYYKGKVWLEIFIVPGINDNEEEINNFIKIIKKIKVEKVQLNTLDRAGTEKWVDNLCRKDLEEIARRFKENIFDAKIEIL